MANALDCVLVISVEVVPEHSLTLDACADDSGAATNLREFADDSSMAFSVRTRNVARTALFHEIGINRNTKLTR